jgi:hypothetical protein
VRDPLPFLAWAAAIVAVELIAVAGWRTRYRWWILAAIAIGLGGALLLAWFPSILRVVL